MILRIVCFILLFFGHLLLFSPIITVLKWIPLVGYLLGAMVQLAAVLFCLVYVPFLQFTITAVAMVFYRPLLGAFLFAISAVLLGAMFLVQGSGADGMP